MMTDQCTTDKVQKLREDFIECQDEEKECEHCSWRNHENVCLATDNVAKIIINPEPKSQPELSGTQSFVIDGDDGGQLFVTQTCDGDMHLMTSNSDIHTNMIRFRTYFGGGKHEKVRVAVRELMKAIESSEEGE